MLGTTKGNISAIAAAVLKTFRLIISDSISGIWGLNPFRGWTFPIPRTDRAHIEPDPPDLYVK
jgi:hypothetical protein